MIQCSAKFWQVVSSNSKRPYVVRAERTNPAIRRPLSTVRHRILLRALSDQLSLRSVGEYGQIEDLEMTSRNPCVDGGAIPARHIFKNPGCKIADIVDPRAAMRVETIIVCKQISRRRVVHVHRIRIRHVDLHVAERVKASSCRTVKFGERSDDQSTDCGLISSSRAPSTRICIRLKSAEPRWCAEFYRVADSFSSVCLIGVSPIGGTFAFHHALYHEAFRTEEQRNATVLLWLCPMT